MGNERRRFTENEKMILYREVDGLCPICGKKLMHKKRDGTLVKNFEVAHIYPVNPTMQEDLLLSGEERLGNDINSLENVIALCLSCHKKFDTNKTVDEYREMINIKKRLIQMRNGMDLFSQYKIEDEIQVVLKSINNDSNESSIEKLNLSALKIDDKTNKTLPFLIKRSIKNDVVDYFTFIQKQLIELDKNIPNKSIMIAVEIKSFYLQTMLINDNQEFIYYSLVNWLNNKTGNYSKRACEIIVAFYIQDCEVFS